MDADAAPPESVIAAAIGEPARTQMLYSLVDGRARTSTELAVIAAVAPSTASVHLGILRERGLVEMAAQGKHRYYRLAGPAVAAALEALSVLAGSGRPTPPPSTTPPGLRAARTCYDHIAGALGVAWHDRLQALGWLRGQGDTYAVSAAGEVGFAALGIEMEALRNTRRRFAAACLDWSERRPHLGGALGAALLQQALRHRWVTREVESRGLALTRLGARTLRERFGVVV